MFCPLSRSNNDTVGLVNPDLLKGINGGGGVGEGGEVEINSCQAGSSVGKGEGCNVGAV